MNGDDSDLAVPAGYAHDIFDLTGRVAVVTGAGSGLGEAISIGFAQAGMTVFLADVNVPGAERVAALISGHGATAIVKELDVVNKAACDAAADEVVAEAGRVDVLVNSAGSAFRCPAEDFPEDKFDFIVGLNMKGTYLCCQAFGRKMLAQGKGSIINMGSIGGAIAYPLASAYLASKGAVVQITKGLALEWRDRGVRVNAIGPTLMDSPLTRAAAATTSVTADFIKARMLRPRLGLPRELIGAAIFLASDASELVTGHMLMCDDGYLTA
jgi:NAD(P)-dependent dehydrogenase (short-subunit alcohol dehydrogenase family)